MIALLVKGAVLLVVIGIALHTASYGLWALRQGNRRGAAGVFVLAGATVVAPILVWTTAP